MSGSEKMAIVQGEFHLSSKDADELIDRNTKEWDVILVKGREPVYSLENAQFGFWYYAIGAIITRTLMGLIHTVKEKLGVGNNTPWEDLDIDTNCRIDAHHREIWGFTNKRVRMILLALASLASIWALLNPNFLKNWNDTFFSTYHSVIFFFPFLPMLLHIIAIVNPTNSGKRNGVMANSIEEYSEENSHKRALILVGEMHRKGVAKHLEKQGWTVKSNPTYSRIGRAISHVYGKFGNWD